MPNIFDADVEAIEPEQKKTGVPERGNLFADGDVEIVGTEPQPTELESGARGVLQGATMGFSDEIVGGLEGGYKALTEGQPLGSAYEKARNESRQANEIARQANPKSYTAGEVGGAIGTAFIPGMGQMNVAKAAGMGALSAAGLSKADASTFEGAKELAKEVGQGAALGGISQYGFDKFGKAIKSISPTALADYAEKQAVKATGAMTKEMRVLEQTGQLQSKGRQLLDEGVVTPLSSLGDVAERGTGIRKEAGKALNQLYSKVDEAVGPAINGESLSQKILDAAAKMPDTAQNRAIQNKMLAEAEIFAQKGMITFDEAQRLKNSFKFSVTDPVTHSLGKDGNNQIKAAIESVMTETADEAAKLGIIPDQAYQTAKKLSGLGSFAETTAKKRLGTTQSSRDLGLTSYMTGGAVLAGGGTPVMSGISAIANQAAIKYGASLKATGADKLAKVLAAAPESFGKYSSVLRDAALRGNHSLGVTHFVLMQKDPNYRTMYKTIDEGSDEQQ